MNFSTHKLHSPRLVLRLAQPGDLEALLAMRDDSKLPDASRDARVRALVENNAAHFATFGFGLWLVNEGVNPIGFVGLRPRETAYEPELYYGLVPAARRQGFATEAAAAVIERLFGTPSVTGVWAVTDPDNVGSYRVLERLGMTLEHKGEFDGKPSRVYRLRRAQR